MAGRFNSSPPACCSRLASGSRSGSQRLAPARPTPNRRGRCGIWALSLLVGTVGGIYGIGGGSILASILLALGYSAYEVAPATLTATFLTSIGGIVTYQLLRATQGGTSP